MNLCDNKNLQILEISNNINNKLKDMSKLIEENTISFTEQLKKNYLCFDEEIIAKFDDFYWDIKVRCEKYTDHIYQFQNTLYDIYKRNGCLDKLKDLLSLFDSKNNKGKDVLFNQQFFIKMNDLSSLNTDVVKSMAKKLYFSNGKVRTTSKNRFASKSKFTTGSQTDKKEDTKKNKSIGKTKSNNLLNKANNDNANLNEIKEPEKPELKKVQSNISKINASIPKRENIILNQRLIQRFYAYSVLDYYSKYFKVNINNEDKDLDEENNIYMNNKYNDISKSKKGIKSGKNGARIRGNNAMNKNKNENNKESNSNLDPKNMKNNRLRSNIKSVSLLSNYSERYTELKEKVKPIINTNYIQLFDPATTKISKIKVPLTKE